MPAWWLGNPGPKEISALYFWCRW